MFKPTVSSLYEEYWYSRRVTDDVIGDEYYFKSVEGSGQWIMIDLLDMYWLISTRVFPSGNHFLP